MRWAALLLAIAAVGCGASLRRLHLSEMYFERCYAGDRNDTASDPERRACWLAWLEHWREGQPIERIDYASERVATLDPDRAAILAIALTDEPTEEEMAAGESLDAGTTLETSEAGAELPSTTTSTTTTTTVREDLEASERAAELHRRHRPIAPSTSSPACAAACEPAWVRCTDACTEYDRGCVNACRVSFRGCARGCF